MDSKKSLEKDRTDASTRRRARESWPVAVYRLGEEPPDDLSEMTTPAQRVAMMAELAESAWTVAGKPLPAYDRRATPGRLFRPGQPRPDENDA